MTPSISLQGLSVNKDVKAGKVIPGQYLILSFNFSGLYHSDDIKVAETVLNNMINKSIEQFYNTYASYLGSKTSEQLIQDLIMQDNAISSFAECISVVQEKLRAVKGFNNHLLGDVKGVSNRSYLHCCLLSLNLEFVLFTDLSPS